MLISEVATHVRNSIGDRGGIVASDASILFWSSEAVLDIYRKTNLSTETVQEVTVSKDSTSHTTENILRVNEIYNVTENCLVTEVNPSDISNSRGPEFRYGKGPVIHYYNESKGGPTLYWIQIPDKETVLKISLTQYPARYDSMNDNLSLALPANFHMDVVRFCIMRGHEKEKDFRSAEKAQEHYVNNIYERRDEASRLEDDFATISPDPYDSL